MPARTARVAGRMSGSLEGGERTVEEPGDRRRLLEEGVVPIGRFEQVERLRPTESRAEQLELPEGDQGVAGHGDEGDRRGDSRRVHRVQIERLGELTTSRRGPAGGERGAPVFQPGRHRAAACVTRSEAGVEFPGGAIGGHGERTSQRHSVLGAAGRLAQAQDLPLDPASGRGHRVAPIGRGDRDHALHEFGTSFGERQGHHAAVGCPDRDGESADADPDAGRDDRLRLVTGGDGLPRSGSGGESLSGEKIGADELHRTAGEQPRSAQHRLPPSGGRLAGNRGHPAGGRNAAQHQNRRRSGLSYPAQSDGAGVDRAASLEQERAVEPYRPVNTGRAAHLAARSGTWSDTTRLPGSPKREASQRYTRTETCSMSASCAARRCTTWAPDSARVERVAGVRRASRTAAGSRLGSRSNTPATSVMMWHSVAVSRAARKTAERSEAPRPRVTRAPERVPAWKPATTGITPVPRRSSSGSGLRSSRTAAPHGPPARSPAPRPDRLRAGAP